MCFLSVLQASFVSSGNRTDISLEDPDFWQKWAKKAELDLDVLNGRVSAETHRHPPLIKKSTIHLLRSCFYFSVVYKGKCSETIIFEIKK